MKEIYYFAYGSNLDKERMIERKCAFLSVEKAHLEDFLLIFNKRSQKNPEAGFGNVIPKKGEIVEGMLYKVYEDKLQSLDKYEGYPKHYTREEMDIVCGDNKIKAFVYIASKEWVTEGLKPSKEYISHFLAGKEYLSSEYYQRLKNTVTLD